MVIYPSILTFIHIFIHPHIHPSIHPSSHSSIHPSIRNYITQIFTSFRSKFNVSSCGEINIIVPMVPNVGRFSVFQENRRFFQFLPECKGADPLLVEQKKNYQFWAVLTFLREWFGLLPELRESVQFLNNFLIFKIFIHESQKG